MKKTVFALFLAVSSVFLISNKNFEPTKSTSPAKKIEVSTMEEFIQALGNDRIIIVNPGTYTFPNVGDLHEPQGLPSALDKLSPFYDSTYIHDVKNLTIIGVVEGEQLPYFMESNINSYVVKLKNVSDVKIENLKMGHDPYLGECVSGVLMLENCNNVSVKSLVLDGSGTEGFTLFNVNDFTADDCLITNCSFNLSTFCYVSNAVLKNCVIKDNKSRIEGFILTRSEVTFTNLIVEERFSFDPLKPLEGDSAGFFNSIFSYVDQSVYECKQVEGSLAPDTSIVIFNNFSLNNFEFEKQIFNVTIKEWPISKESDDNGYDNGGYDNGGYDNGGYDNGGYDHYDGY